MPKAKPPIKKNPEEYIDSYSKMRTKLNSPDRKDYKRTIAGRGDTHALDGGRIPASVTLSPLYLRKLQKAMQYKKSKQSLIKSWEDRNPANQGTKLNP